MYVFSGPFFFDSGARGEDLNLRFLGVCILGVDKHSFKDQTIESLSNLQALNSLRTCEAAMPIGLWPTK